MVSQCRANVEPPSATLAQHWPSIVCGVWGLWTRTPLRLVSLYIPGVPVTLCRPGQGCQWPSAASDRDANEPLLPNAPLTSLTVYTRDNNDSLKTRTLLTVYTRGITDPLSLRAPLTRLTVYTTNHLLPRASFAILTVYTRDTNDPLKTRTPPTVCPIDITDPLSPRAPLTIINVYTSNPLLPRAPLTHLTVYTRDTTNHLPPTVPLKPLRPGATAKLYIQ